jgi:hypothetical protein
MIREVRSMLRGQCTRLLWWALLLAGAPCGRLMSGTFLPGDVNSSGSVNVTDAIGIFRHLFLGDSALVSCLAAADVDGNARIDLSDGIGLLSYLFLGGEPPVSPLLPGCSVEPRDNPLSCEFSLPCSKRGFFFVLSKDGSMQEGTKFKRLQEEVVRAIQGLDDEDEFGVVFYDASMVKFPIKGTPAQGGAAMKSAAIAFVLSTVPGHGTCPKPALITGLSFARESTAGEKSIVFISDGFTTCPNNDPAVYGQETLAEVASRNVDHVPIHAICVGPPGSVDENFMRRIAADSGGTFRRIMK